MTALTRDAVTGLAGSGMSTTDTAAPRLGIDGRPVPLLRGRIHEAAVVPAGATGVAATAAAEGMSATAAAAVFTFSIVAMLTASAVYHCHSVHGVSQRHAQRVDHAMILIAIAGTQTAYWMVLQPAAIATMILTPVWLTATIGFGRKLRSDETLSPGGDWFFAVLGLAGVALLPLLATTDGVALILVAMGGAIYSLGGALLRFRIGDLHPGVFGYHEVWHLLVLVGATCHFLALIRLISATS